MASFILSAEQMRQTEQSAFLNGVNPLLLMEQAAHGIVAKIEEISGAVRGKKILVACGPGNNGGDGLAAARLLHLRGALVTIVMPQEPVTEEARINKQYAHYYPLPVHTHLPDGKDYDAILDALFGIGLSRSPEGEIADLISQINLLPCPVFSIDLPSGMNGNTGEVYASCICAQHTLAIHAFKKCFFVNINKKYTGAIHCIPLGLTQTDHFPGIPYFAQEDLPYLLPPRPETFHKGDCGRILIFAGSKGKAGAAAMCALAALKAGAGLVTIACPDELINILQTLVPNNMCVERHHIPDISFDVVAAGCGIGTDEDAFFCLQEALRHTDKAILDADALSLLSVHSMTLPATAVLTPHIAEGARLLHTSIENVMQDPFSASQEIAGQYHAISVLKSHVTYISDGNELALNIIGSPALAKGGSGDALCGILAAQLCESNDALLAARIACLRLGVASQKAAAAYGVRGTLTSQILDHLTDIMDIPS